MKQKSQLSFIALPNFPSAEDLKNYGEYIDKSCLGITIVICGEKQQSGNDAAREMFVNNSVTPRFKELCYFNDLHQNDMHRLWRTAQKCEEVIRETLREGKDGEHILIVANQILICAILICWAGIDFSSVLAALDTHRITVNLFGNEVISEKIMQL
jgi:hypothetical protein